MFRPLYIQACYCPVKSFPKSLIPNLQQDFEVFHTTFEYGWIRTECIEMSDQLYTKKMRRNVKGLRNAAFWIYSMSLMSFKKQMFDLSQSRVPLPLIMKAT